MAVDTGWNNETSRNNEQVSRTEFQIVDRQFGVFILLFFWFGVFKYISKYYALSK